MFVVSKMMKEKINVSVVAYLNAQPFLYGLEHHHVKNKLSISKDIPSECARKLLNKEADIGLVPVAVIPMLTDFEIIGKTCIGAIGKVASVLLCSDVPLEEIKHIFLDFHSRTSVTLVQVLSKHFWKISPAFKQAPENYIEEIKGSTAGVIIGDRTFNLKKEYAYKYDLAEEWQKFTNLPFVFAAWVGRKGLSQEIVNDFEAALQYGLKEKQRVIKEQEAAFNGNFDVAHYLNTNIQYVLDESKEKGLALFFDYLKKMDGLK